MMENRLSDEQETTAPPPFARASSDSNGGLFILIISMNYIENMFEIVAGLK